MSKVITASKLELEKQAMKVWYELLDALEKHGEVTLKSE